MRKYLINKDSKGKVIMASEIEVPEQKRNGLNVVSSDAVEVDEETFNKEFAKLKIPKVKLPKLKDSKP